MHARYARFAAIAGFVSIALSCAAPPTNNSRDGGVQCNGGSCIRTSACRAGGSGAQFRTQTAPPGDLLPGEHAMVSVTFDNCSGQTWTRSDFSLRPAAPSDSGTWSVARASLPDDVADGSQVTIPFEVVAPLTSGTYPFTWAIHHEGVGPMQEASTRVDVQVRSSGDCSQAGPPARFVSMEAPPQFAATGGMVHATLTFTNCSTETWTRDGGFHLGSSNERDNTTWGTTRVSLPQDVPPGSQVTVPVDVTAPTQPGTYSFSWGVVHEGVRWFDEASPPRTVTVLEPVDCTTPGAVTRFVRETQPPGTVDPGQSFHSVITMGNCTGETWDRSYHLGAAAPSNDSIWSAGRIDLPVDVGTGFAIDIPLDAHSPGNPGPYPYRWAMVHDGVGALDEPSPQHDITVRCIPQCGGHNCGGDGCGGSCGSCGGGATCEGGRCQDSSPSCGALQWWNTYQTYFHIVGGWNDTDLGVRSSTPIQLRHRSRLDRTGVYAWGYMPEFTDLVTGYRYRLLHLRPQYQWATNVGQVYPAGFIVGLSGGDTPDTGLGPYSTGQHLCVQTLASYRTVFPSGVDACH